MEKTKPKKATKRSSYDYEIVVSAPSDAQGSRYVAIYSNGVLLHEEPIGAGKACLRLSKSGMATFRHGPKPDSAQTKIEDYLWQHTVLRRESIRELAEGIIGIVTACVL